MTTLIKFSAGQEIYVEGTSVCGLPDYTPSMGDDFLIWEGHGYSGGHVSQGHWDIDQQYKKALELLQAGYEVYDATERGRTGGYYPALKYRLPR